MLCSSNKYAVLERSNSKVVRGVDKNLTPQGSGASYKLSVGCCRKEVLIPISIKTEEVVSKEVILLLYMAPVRSAVGYCMKFCCRHIKRDIEKLKKVQKILSKKQNQGLGKKHPIKRDLNFISIYRVTS